MDPTVQVAIVTTAGGIGVAVVGALAEFVRRQGKAINEVREHSQEARKQVQNSHSTNLRDDVDRVLAGIEKLVAGQANHAEALRQHGREIGGLRRDIAHERVERLEVARRLDGHLTTVASATAATVAAVVGTDTH